MASPATTESRRPSNEVVGGQPAEQAFLLCGLFFAPGPATVPRWERLSGCIPGMPERHAALAPSHWRHFASRETLRAQSKSRQGTLAVRICSNILIGRFPISEVIRLDGMRGSSQVESWDASH